MADLSLDCPSCGAANVVPMEPDSDTFTCAECDVESPIESSVSLATAEIEDYLVGQVIGE